MKVLEHFGVKFPRMRRIIEFFGAKRRRICELENAGHLLGRRIKELEHESAAKSIAIEQLGALHQQKMREMKKKIIDLEVANQLVKSMKERELDL